MRKSLSEYMVRSAAVAAIVMTLLAGLLMSLAPALAEPEEGAGYWTDSFSDFTGISASTNISISGGDVKLTLGSALSTYNYVGVNRSTNNHYAYYCDEDDNSTPPALDETTEATDAQYSLISANDTNRWQTPDPGRNDYVFLELIQQVSEPEQYITNVDLIWRGYGEVSGTFWVWIYNNESSTWSQLGSSQEIATGADSTLTRSITTNITDYISATGLLTWGVFFDETTTAVGSNGRWMRTNYVQTIVTYNRYSTPGNLNSVSITPASLQSWSTFYANDSKYSKAISITGTGTALTDYQINVPVTFVSGKMNADFSDLIFIDGSGNMLSYWIESYVASTSAQVWVKVPSIAASGTTTIYMYYGTAAAISASNGSNTFIFFDDFSGDLSKWTKEKNGGNISIASGYLECGGGETSSPFGHTVLGSTASYSAFTNGIIDGKVYLATDGIAEVGYRGNNASNTGYKSRMDARPSQGLGHLMPPYADGSWIFISSGGGPTGTAIPASTWYNFRIIVNGSSLNISCAGQSLAGTNTSYAGPGEISLQNHYGLYVRYDDIRVRKYASPEPATSTGSEVAVSANYKILKASDDSVLCTITSAQAATGYDISSCASNTSSIKLRAEFSTGNTSYTPILYDWRVTWTTAVVETISITAPANISSWDLDPSIGENIQNGTFQVTVSGNSSSWHVTVNDSDPVTAGYMTQWYSGNSSYGTLKLSSPMRISTAYEVTLPAGGTIVTGTGNNSSIPVTFKQTVSWEDDPGDYRIVITFVAWLD